MSYSLNGGDYAYLICRIALAIVGTLANVFLVYVIRKRRELNSNTFKFICHQAISDAIYMFLVVFESLSCNHHFAKVSRYTLIICECNFTLQILMLQISYIFILYVALDRFYKLYWPVSKNVNGTLVAYLTWLVMGLFAFIQMPTLRVIQFFGNDSLFYCFTPFVEIKEHALFKNYFAMAIMRGIIVWSCFLLPTVLYILVVIKIYMIKSIGNRTEVKAKESEDRKKKTIIMLVIMMVVFNLCNLPNFLHLIDEVRHPVKPICPNVPFNINTPFLIFLFTSQLSSMTNAFILCWFNDIFSRELKALVRKICRKPLSENVAADNSTLSTLPYSATSV